MKPLLFAVPAVAALAAFAFSSPAKAKDETPTTGGGTPGPSPGPFASTSAGLPTTTATATAAPAPSGSTPSPEVIELIEKAVQSGNTSFMLTTADVLDKMGWKEQAASLRAAAKDIANATGTAIPSAATTAKSAGLPPMPVSDTAPVHTVEPAPVATQKATAAEVEAAREAMGLPPTAITVAPPVAPAPAPAAFAPTVTIHKGEGPYQVTMRLLKSAAKWKELRDYNKDQFPVDPKSGSNKWNPGDKARIPPSWGFTSSVAGDPMPLAEIDDPTLASRVALNVSQTRRGDENKELIETFQQQQRELGHYDGDTCGQYNAQTALCLARYGIAPPKPMYWPVNPTPTKNAYRGALMARAGADPVRAEEWVRAANVEYA